MLIKKLNFTHYKLINKFLKANNSSLPNSESWKFFNNISKKNLSLFLDGLFINNKLVGYHSTIVKYLVFKKRKYKVLVSSNLNVSKKYRKSSIFLINKYFKQKSDIYITTTSNEKSSTIWKLFGSSDVNSISCKIALYQITNYFNYISGYLIKKKIKFIPKFLIKFLAYFLDLFFDRKKSIKNKDNIKFKIIDKYSKNLENYNKIFEFNCNYPIEKRSNFALSRYIKILELNKKKVYIYQILNNNNKMIGYLVLIIENYNGSKRIFLGELKIDKKYQKDINQILLFSNRVAIDNGCTYIYYRNIKPSILKAINTKNFFISKYDFNPYKIKIGSKRASVLKKYLKNDWGTSYLDGDCLL